jgi:hypothetical protein
MSYAEPLITIALIALALIFNRPIGNAAINAGFSRFQYNGWRMVMDADSLWRRQYHRGRRR